MDKVSFTTSDTFTCSSKSEFHVLLRSPQSENDGTTTHANAFQDTCKESALISSLL